MKTPLIVSRPRALLLSRAAGLALLAIGALALSAAAQQAANPSAAAAFLAPPAAAAAGSPAPAPPLPRWFVLHGEIRERAEGVDNVGFNANADDAYLLQRTRLSAQLTPIKWLKLGLEGQDARAFGKDLPPHLNLPFEDTAALRQAWLELGDLETQHLTLRVGRQLLDFGDQRVLGSLDWANTARSFDAVRGTYAQNGVRLDLFSAAVVIPRGATFDRSVAGNVLHGAYASLTHLVPQATVEPYLLWRLDSPGLSPATLAGTAGRLDEKTLGLRFVGLLPAHFDYNTETDLQRGHNAADPIVAWATHALVGYSLPALAARPKLVGEFNYASGTHRAGQRGTFDMLYPTGHGKYGLADLVGWQNIENLRLGVLTKPSRRLGFNADLYHDWLAQASDGLYNAAGVRLVAAHPGAGRFVGREADLTATWAGPDRLQLAAGFAHLFPGAFLKAASPGHAYNFAYLQTLWAF